MSTNDAGGTNENLPTLAPLSGTKHTALELMVSGKSVAETARTCGVDRTTIFRWLRQDATFRTAYNQWKEELKESCRGRLLALTDKATMALETALEKGDAKSALALLRGLGLIEKQKPECVDEEEVAARAEIAEKKRKSDLEAAKRKVDIDDKYSRLTDAKMNKTVDEWDVQKPGGMNNTSVSWSNE
jgi:transposase-like protein